MASIHEPTDEEKSTSCKRITIRATYRATFMSTCLRNVHPGSQKYNLPQLLARGLVGVRRGRRSRGGGGGGETTCYTRSLW